MAESKKDEKKEVTDREDEELDDLLNSALSDFDNCPAAESTIGNGKEVGAAENNWTEDFFKDVLKGESPFQSEDGNMSADQFAASFQKIAEAASKAISDEATEGGFDEAISRALQNLSEGVENIQAPALDDQLSNMLSGLGLGDGAGESNDFIKFMHSMMQTLLTKEILYPTLKTVVDKYPVWLSQNKEKLEDSEYDRYTKQMSLMQQICQELEKESDSDSVEVKEQRCNTILDLMQKMQNCGQPPKDLVDDMGPAISFDDEGNPVFPSMPGVSDPSQCSVM